MDLLLKLYSIQGFSSGDLSPGITGATTLKYRLEDEVISDYIWRNSRYYRHYSFWKDIEMIFATALGFWVWFGGEEV